MFSQDKLNFYKHIVSVAGESFTCRKSFVIGTNILRTLAGCIQVETHCAVSFQDPRTIIFQEKDCVFNEIVTFNISIYLLEGSFLNIKCGLRGECKQVQF